MSRCWPHLAQPGASLFSLRVTALRSRSTRRILSVAGKWISFVILKHCSIHIRWCPFDNDSLTRNAIEPGRPHEIPNATDHWHSRLSQLCRLAVSVALALCSFLCFPEKRSSYATIHQAPPTRPTITNADTIPAPARSAVVIAVGGASGFLSPPSPTLGLSATEEAPVLFPRGPCT